MMTTLLNIEKSVIVDLRKCDRCIARGAQAFIKNGQSLVFCQHHTNSYEAELFMGEWTQLKHPETLDNSLDTTVQLDTEDTNYGDGPETGVAATI